MTEHHYFSVGKDTQGRAFFTRRTSEELERFTLEARKQGYSPIATASIRDRLYDIAIHFCEAYKNMRINDQEITEALTRLAK